MTEDPYPCQIIADRYGGAYSGAPWLAFSLWDGFIPAVIGGSDPDEQNFWWRWEQIKQPPIGRGKTPNEALKDLKTQL
jgi:hypothetical protein